MIITGDFETFFTKDYSLSRMSEAEYVLDDRFETIMCALKVDAGPSEVFVGQAAVANRLAQVDWSRSAWLSHNTRFDGAILAWRYGYVPRLYLDSLSMARAVTHWTLGKSSLKALSDYFELPPKGEEAVKAVGKHLSDFTPTELADYVTYCARDNDNAFDIFNEMRGRMRASELQLIDLILRMFIVPQVMLAPDVIARHLAEVQAEKARALAQVSTIDKDYFSSNQKFAKLLEDNGVTVPTKVSPTTGVDIPALARGDWAFKELCADAAQPPFIQALLATRVSVKSTIDETRAQALLRLSQIRWPTQGTGWATVPLKYSGARCVPGDTEVFTRQGWIALQDWDGGDIAQVYPDQRIEFLPATRFIGDPTFEWVTVDAPYLKCRFTPGHVMPYLRHGSHDWATMQAINLLDRDSTIVPIGGSLIGSGSITPEQMRVLVMVQADGHWQTKAPGRSPELRIKVMKPRKIERARSLLRAASIIFREGLYASQIDYVSFRVSGPDWPEWLTIERKLFGEWLLDSTPEARAAFIDELVHWDGHVQNNQLEYSTVDQVNADWVMTMAHLTGFSARISTKPPTDKGRKLLYRVRLRRRASAYVFDKHVETENPPYLTPFCATTQTGFFLARRQGRIFVTGNTHRLSGDGGTNWQNIRRGSTLKRAIVAPEGWRIVHRDASQIEARMVAWMAFCKTLLDAFAKGEDVYSSFASIVYGQPITKANTMERFVGKTSILGLGYGCGAARFRHMLFIGAGGVSLKISLKEAETIVATYRAEYPEIPDLWGAGDKLLRYMIVGQQATLFASNALLKRLPIRPVNTGLWLPNDLCITYPELGYNYTDTGSDICYEDSYSGKHKIYGAKLVENVSQALARIVVTDIALRVYNLTGYHPWLSTHDSLDYCVPEYDAAGMDAELARQFAIVPDWAQDLPLDSAGGWGRTLHAAERSENS